MTRWVVFSRAREQEAYELASAIDKILGYPRDEVAERFGDGRHHEGLVHTESHSAIVQLSNGSIAVQVDSVVDGLHGRSIEIALDLENRDVDLGNRAVDLGKRTVMIDVSAAAQVDLTDSSTLPPRGRRITKGIQI
jgi:hypothetical protein